MINDNQIQQAQGSDVYGSDGQKIGRAAQIYLDDQTGRPEWVTVQTGLFGTKETFVPLTRADLDDNGLTVAFTKDAVKDAPNIDPDGHLSQDDERNLYQHYGLDYSEKGSDSGLPAGKVTDGHVDANREHGRDQQGTVGRDAPSPTTDEAMTRSEERLNVGTRNEETGRARLRKYVVTEEQTVTVPVTREEVRVEREPITDANRDEASAGSDISEAEHEVTLHAERPVVQTEAVPVERVRLTKDQVTDEETVTGEVRKEVIDTEGVSDDH